MSEESRALRRCLPCRVCGSRPEWGSGYLLCPNGHYETCYDEPAGAAVREWNREMKGEGR